MDEVNGHVYVPTVEEQIEATNAALDLWWRLCAETRNHRSARSLTISFDELVKVLTKHDG